MIQAELILANSQKLALKASKVLEASLEDKDQEDILVSKDQEVILALLDHKDHKDHLANADLKEIEVLKALKDKTELFHLMN